MRNSVQGLETFVHRDLKYRCSRIIEQYTARTPLLFQRPPTQISAFAAVPDRCVLSHIQAPRDKLSAAERRWQRRHA